ncbi:AraC family transcription regulator protein [Herbaspirillum rubrisubalbicans M1]|uniref:helix-turn-helix domain-containing protein n=1 Tax=Herbaspirillum rubrisubalbicans TaxID=80842 RepID=UPI00073A1630|nr:helix-turn-helix domain-containing protein [Herbaspirillum rubrisubalbicans]ALU90077.1 AraC family transcription regulator protein [Herbaspirillum rubrisubalbicans M1]
MSCDDFSVHAVQFSDVDEQASMLTGWEQEYQQLGSGRFVGALAMVQTEEFCFIRESTNTALHERIVPPPDQLVIGLCNTEQYGHLLNGRPLTQDQLVVLDGSRAHHIRTTGPIELVGMSVQRDLFLSQLHEQDEASVRKWLDLSVLQLDAATAGMLRHYFSVVFELLDAPSGKAARPISPRALASTAISNVALALSLNHGSHELESTLPSRQRRERIVQNAIDYMRLHAGEEIGILDVCRATHVSRRTLQYCFEERLDISPLQYLKALRLNAAHREIKRRTDQDRSHDRQATIGNLAALCGFNHPSRFASEYKKMFGVLPSETVLKAVAEP